MKLEPRKQAARPKWALPNEGSVAGHDDLRQLVHTLAAARSLDDPNAREALEGLRAIASHGSRHFIAGEIQSIADRLPAKRKDGTVYTRGRGYCLAADLYLKDLLKEIAKVETGERPIGPSIFRGYCNEVVDCLFAAEKAQRGVEIPLELVDGLLAKAIGSVSHQEIYLTLAIQALNSVQELAIQKLGRDAVIRRKTIRSDMSEETPPPGHRSKHTSIDKEIISYLNGLKQSVTLIKEHLSQWDGSLPLSGHERSREQDQNHIREQFLYLQRLSRIADTAGYEGFAGLVHQQLGELVQKWLYPAKGIQFFFEAAKDYESQGDVEQALLLVQLSARRYRSAEGLYNKTGDVAGARRVRLTIVDTQEPLPPFSIPLE